jgi:hypothetical protein
MLLISSMIYAQYLTEAYVRYDSKYLPDIVDDRGGAEGNSGAYVSILAGINNYHDLKSVNLKAKKLGTDFEFSLLGDSEECAGIWPFETVDIWYFVSLRPAPGWMTGDWEIVLKYSTNDGIKGTESMMVTVPRFNFPPAPTGVQIAEYQDKKWLVWNSIGEPGSGTSNRKVEYRIAHYTSEPEHCIDKWYAVRPYGNINYQVWSGNRIAVEIPYDWSQGDLIRIENRIYDNNGGTVYRSDRGTRYIFMR